MVLSQPWLKDTKKIRNLNGSLMGTDAALMSSPTQSRVAALFLSAICLWCCDSCVVEKRASLSPSLPSNSTSGLCWCCDSPALLRDDRLHLAPAFMVVSRMDGGVLIPVMQEELWKGHWQKKQCTHAHTHIWMHPHSIFQSNMSSKYPRHRVHQ